MSSVTSTIMLSVLIWMTASSLGICSLIIVARIYICIKGFMQPPTQITPLEPPADALEQNDIVNVPKELIAFTSEPTSEMLVTSQIRHEKSDECVYSNNVYVPVAYEV